MNSNNNDIDPATTSNENNDGGEWTACTNRRRINKQKKNQVSKVQLALAKPEWLTFDEWNISVLSQHPNLKALKSACKNGQSEVVYKAVNCLITPNMEFAMSVSDKDPAIHRLWVICQILFVCQQYESCHVALLHAVRSGHVELVETLICLFILGHVFVYKASETTTTKTTTTNSSTTTLLDYNSSHTFRGWVDQIKKFSTMQPTTFADIETCFFRKKSHRKAFDLLVKKEYSVDYALEYIKNKKLFSTWVNGIEESLDNDKTVESRDSNSEKPISQGDRNFDNDSVGESASLIDYHCIFSTDSDCHESNNISSSKVNGNNNNVDDWEVLSTKSQNNDNDDLSVSSTFSVISVTDEYYHVPVNSANEKDGPFKRAVLSSNNGI